jgi:segregation and condensation protein B
MENSAKIEEYSENFEIDNSQEQNLSENSEAFIESMLKNSEFIPASIEQLPQVIEAILFAVSIPVPVAKLVEVTGATVKDLKVALVTLEESLINRGIQLVNVADKYQLRSRPESAMYICRIREEKPRRLTHAALETLSIIAYKQPIVRSEIEKIRGVDSTPTIKTLLDKNFIKIIGYQATVGQPAMYGTTEEFLQVFGLKGLPDLPVLREVNHLEKDPGEVD